MGESIRKIVFDSILFYLQKRGGGSVYWYEITSRIYKKNALDCEELIYKSKINNIFDLSRAQLNIPKRFSTFSASISSLLPSILFKRNIVFHSGYYRFNILSKFTKSLNVITVYDFIPEKFLSGWTKYRIIYRKFFSLLFCDGIICISENTKQDLLKYYPFSRNKKIEVIYCGVSEDYLFKGNYFNHSKTLLFVGSRTSYKNFSVVLDVLIILKDYKLILVGDDLNNHEKELVGMHNLNVTIIKDLTNEELNTLYNEVSCLFYPSSYEGFGIPVIEAMKAGCPVVALNASSVAEISNDAALLAKELNPLEFSELIKSLENIELRTQIINKGLENALKFSWETAASETANFYLKLKYGTL